MCRYTSLWKTKQKRMVLWNISLVRTGKIQHTRLNFPSMLHTNNGALEVVFAFHICTYTGGVADLHYRLWALVIWKPLRYMFEFCHFKVECNYSKYTIWRSPLGVKLDPDVESANKRYICVYRDSPKATFAHSSDDLVTLLLKHPTVRTWPLLTAYIWDRGVQWDSPTLTILHL